ncbi:glycosyltransferase family 4 protein [Aeromonas sp. 96A]|uniref:glycosyltransferase family 4 protein n=1 Tax=Aeromonas sp. 96A TaxID=3452730 RepID=UPI003F79A155
MIIYSDFRWLNSGGIGTFLRAISKRIELVDLNVGGKMASFSSPFGLLVSINKIDAGVVFLAGYIPPLYSRVPYVFTLHDLNHIDRAENSSFFKKLFYHVFIRIGCYTSSSILTVSDFSKHRIVEWSGVSPDKVINVGNGVDPSYSYAVTPYQPGYRYLLCVGNRKKHKNELRVIQAFSQVIVPADVKLVFTGEATQELLDAIVHGNLNGKVIFLGKVPEDELPSVYRGALGLVFPSLYEGFGLPVVEAMACGVPVLTSNSTSLPEVAGDAALLVNPESVDEIRVGIERLVHDEALRTELIAKGLERAKLFSWDAVAARVQAVLDEVTSQYGK